ncbi:hypothetical protein CEXT_722551 [Caerostris extrusa]|uniref:Uncharacterized protein n=1 Tax=Caerostris extrusa TaxID=172846 RepID=A0AAV4TZK2_CAEEX|nr:hypothetical protein CEXT_722551 [Caerostris extrusa]
MTELHFGLGIICCNVREEQTERSFATKTKWCTMRDLAVLHPICYSNCEQIPLRMGCLWDLCLRRAYSLLLINNARFWFRQFRSFSFDSREVFDNI